MTRIPGKIDRSIDRFTEYIDEKITTRIVGRIDRSIDTRNVPVTGS
jgi:hypothetical protein